MTGAEMAMISHILAASKQGCPQRHVDMAGRDASHPIVGPAVLTHRTRGAYGASRSDRGPDLSSQISMAMRGTDLRV